MIQGRLEGVCLGALQGELGLKSSAQCACSARAVQGLPLSPLFCAFFWVQHATSCLTPIFKTVFLTAMFVIARANTCASEQGDFGRV